MTTDQQIDSSSTQTSLESPAATLTEDSLKDHPLVKQLEEEKSAALQEASIWKGRTEKANEKLKNVVLDEEEDIPQPKSATTDDLEQMKAELRWELKHEKEIELAGDDYEKLLKKGVPKEIALEHALLKKEKGSNDGTLKTQTSAAAPQSGVDRSQGAPLEVSLSPMTVSILRKKGYKDEDIKRMDQEAKMRNLSTAQLAL